MRKYGVPLAALVAALVLQARPLAAQQDLSLSILNSGKPPSSPVPVKVVENGTERVVATTDRNGMTEIGVAALDVPTGTRVRVLVVTCGDATEVILLPPGQSSQTCQEAADDAECDCEEVGAVLWGRTPRLVIDTGTGAFTTGETPLPSLAIKPSWTFGAGAYYYTMPNLEDTGCLDASSCDADDTGLGFQGLVEYAPRLGLPVHFGVGVTYGSFTVDQDFGGGDVSTVDTNVLGLRAYTGLSTSLGDRFRIQGNVGIDWLRNSADIVSRIGGTDYTESRDQSGVRARFGAAADVTIWDVLGVRLSGDYVVGDSDDADTNFQFGLAALWFVRGGE